MYSEGVRSDDEIRTICATVRIRFTILSGPPGWVPTKGRLSTHNCA